MGKYRYDDKSPIFIIGRQHCGNTMMTRMLGNHSSVRAFSNEDRFFERLRYFRQLSLDTLTERVVLEAGGSQLDLAEREELVRLLRAEGEDREGLSQPVQIYAKAKEILTEREEAHRWAQKATSYIFSVDTILDVFPKARFLFPVRNPLDIAASKKRRGTWSSVGRMVWGWNKGVARGLMFQKRYPDQFLVFRYEDVCSSPKKEIEKIYTFLGLRFNNSYSDILHVNKSENKHSIDINSRGVDSSRVFYYKDVLGRRQEMGALILASSDITTKLYSDLPSINSPSTDGRASGGAQIYAKKLLLSGILDTFLRPIRRRNRSFSELVHRIWQRMIY